MNIVSPAAAPITPTPVATENTLPREERQQQLPVDRIVRATVAEGGMDRVVLEINHQRIQAETRVPLFTGQRLDLLVVASGSKIELQIVADPLQQRLLHSLHLLGQPLAFDELLQDLILAGQPQITQMSQEARTGLDAWLNLQKIAPDALNGPELHQLIRDLGLGLEALLASGEKLGKGALKSVLLEMTARLKGTGGEGAGHLLQQLELLQLCQVRLAEQNMLLLPLPLPFLEQGYIAIKRDRPGKKGKDALSLMKLAIHLALLGLGNLEIDLLLDAEGIHVRVACETMEKARFVATFTDEIRTALSSLRLRGISFAGGAREPTRALLTLIMPAGTSALDTRV